MNKGCKHCDNRNTISYGEYGGSEHFCIVQATEKYSYYSGTYKDYTKCSEINKNLGLNIEHYDEWNIALLKTLLAISRKLK